MKQRLPGLRRTLSLAAVVVLVPWGGEAAAQGVPSTGVAADQEVGRPITASFVDTPVRDVLFAFADFAGRSIVAGPTVDGLVSAEIRSQPWDLALRAILAAHGLVVHEQADGIIRVDDARSLFDREAVHPMVTRPFRVNYADVTELTELVAGLLSERGRVSAGLGTNTLVVTDVPRVLDAAHELIRELDTQAPQVDITAKIIFINRSALMGFGITYDLKDIGGNQLNLLSPGVADLNGDGEITLPDEQVPLGTNAVSLTGNSIAALGNATYRVVNPTLALLTSLVMGRNTLVAFIDALESVQLTDVEAHPSVRVMDNRTARIVVGEETPVRVIDAGAQLQGRQGEDSRSTLPVATVDYKETGVILEVTPRIADGREVLLELTAERSSADLAPSDVGVIFRRQRAESRVMVGDGETVVIGGLTVTEKGEVRSGIPLLMHLPLVGRLFRSRTETSVQRDLVIMVTPTIVPLRSP